MPTKAPTPCAYPGCRNLAPCSTHDRQRSRQRQARRGTAHQRGYGVAHQKWRRIVLSEDPVCHWPTDEHLCLEVATVADHIKPRAVYPHLALDPRNGQGLCREHHFAKTTEEADGQYRNTRDRMPQWAATLIGESGRVLVTGPPCGGKTTFTERYAPAEAEVVRMEDILKSLTGDPRSRNVDELELRPLFDEAIKKPGDLWAEACRPAAKQRAGLAAAMGADLVVVLETPQRVCMDRSQQRGTNDSAFIRRWFRRFEPSQRRGQIYLGPDEWGNPF